MKTFKELLDWAIGLELSLIYSNYYGSITKIVDNFNVEIRQFIDKDNYDIIEIWVRDQNMKSPMNPITL